MEGLTYKLTTHTHSPKNLNHTSRLGHPQINAWLDELATNNPTLCKVSNVGTSYEGRTMKLLTIGTGAADNPGVFVDGGVCVFFSFIFPSVRCCTDSLDLVLMRLDILEYL